MNIVNMTSGVKFLNRFLLSQNKLEQLFVKSFQEIKFFWVKLGAKKLHANVKIEENIMDKSSLICQSIYDKEKKVY